MSLPLFEATEATKRHLMRQLVVARYRAITFTPRRVLEILPEERASDSDARHDDQCLGGMRRGREIQNRSAQPFDVRIVQEPIMGSPVLGAGGHCPKIDEVFHLRPKTRCDIGAFESR